MTLPKTLPKDHATRMHRARLALAGLSVGDAFGQRFFVNPAVVDSLIASRAVPHCAIVGGIVALATDHVPEAWLAAREPLT